ncbi:hypothetical protein [Agrococcus jejuensis]|uniref:DUF3558 domain-containing protein n=1 Tax=Agrococcus jejuensis TaxID=399736 RepID=A0A1G8GJ74_9MICO|nr:hypothetical protein [Agrococcus jejuensis]SDH94454.1 hypothetical protein SAMN04489720_2959 [Agrococcus jejuensis]
MTRTRAMLALPAALAALVLVGCADAVPAPSPTPSASESPTPIPTPTPEPLTREQTPINCLNVVSAELRAHLLGATATTSVTGRSGPWPMGAVGGELPLPEQTRSTACGFAMPDGFVEGVTYMEFSRSDTAQLLVDLADFGDRGEISQPPGTDLVLEPAPGVEAAQQLVIPFDGYVKAWIVGDGWMLALDTASGVDALAASAPDATVDAAMLTDRFPPLDQTCEPVLPIPTADLDLMARHGLGSGTTVASRDTPICHANEASGYERVLWWEDVTAADREQLLDDAAAGVDGMRLQGSTLDGGGAIVALADDTRLVVFDAVVVHLAIPIDGELALQLARHVHAPAWLDVPPVA